jgi:hypothetical protein
LFIASIDQIHVGFRDAEGYIRSEVKEFQVKSLVNDENKSVCLQFLRNFLNKVKEELKNQVDDPNKVYCIKWNQIQKKIDVSLDKSGMIFLPEDYVAFVNKL